ncbi:UPF0746 protein DDB_G0281095-like [Centropristis striata]|uniref:UPF0746 protein DDB_G0281095-like n=1 Tax=Centropristis striata TaxID=184440 RepID=UPI0027DEC27D|nr:UPF0746 protein DDB_G0281095-like [Centropristis striata]
MLTRSTGTGTGQELNVSRQLQQQRQGHLEELDRQIEDKQDVEAAVRQLEDRGRRLSQQQLQLNQLKEELQHKKEGLQQKDEELQQKEEELQHKEEERGVKEEELNRTEEQQQEDRREDESFYLSTAGLRSAFSSEEDRWTVELQREKLRQEENELKARLRCSLWTQQDNLTVRRLETEDTLLGLRHRLDQLDSLLTHTHTHTHTHTQL